MKQVKAIKLSDGKLVLRDTSQDVVAWVAKDGTLHRDPQKCQLHELTCAIAEYLDDICATPLERAEHIVEYLRENGCLNMYLPEAWVNVYADGNAYLHESRESADKHTGNRIACARLHYCKELENNQ